MTTEEFLQAARDRHPGALFLCRTAGGWQAFGEDAEIMALAIGLRVTRSEQGKTVQFPQADFESNLRKLLRNGHRVAACDSGESEGKP